MKKIIDNKRLMIKVCDLYYNQKMNQRKIAGLLNISHPTVSQLLFGALDMGIVNISVNNINSIKYWDVEEKIKKMYGLKDVIVVDFSENKVEQNQKLGIAGAQYLETIIKDGDKVGISMGSTLYCMAHSLLENFDKDVTFVPLIGGMGKLHTELHSNHLAEIMAKKYNGVFLPLYAPARVSNESIIKKLKKEPSISEIISLQKNLSIAFVGIGYPNDNSSIKATGYYEDNEIQTLLKREAVGEICMQFYDISGDTAMYKEHNNVVGINLKQFQKIPYCVGVAGGEDKLPAICGAINGKYINVLITDIACAKGLIDLHKEMEEKDE